MWKKFVLSAALVASVFLACSTDSSLERPEVPYIGTDSGLDAERDVIVDVSGDITSERDADPSDSGWDTNPDATTDLDSGTTTSIFYRGVCLSGAEWGTALPGRENRDYFWPTTSEIDYFMSKGMNTFRIGFSWERLQPTALSNFNTPYYNKLDSIVTYATAKGAIVALNPHNFARFYGNTIGSTQVPNSYFVDLWKRLATKYSNNPNVTFSLVNEPNTMPTEQWVAAANAAIAGIRSVGAGNEIWVPGNAWTGAHSWNDNWYGTPNAKAMLSVVDPANNFIIEVHQYLDANAGGGGATCVNATIGRARLLKFVEWLRLNNLRGVVAEFGAASNPTCDAAITDMLHYMHDNADVLAGWLWWAGGPNWGDSYILGLDPRSNGNEAPQMSLLTPFLK